MDIRFASPALPASGTLVVGLFADRSVAAPELDLAAFGPDGATGGLIARALAASPRFQAKPKQLLPLLAPEGLGPARLLLVGLGEPSGLDEAALEQVGGTILAHLNAAGEQEATVVLGDLAGAKLGGAEGAAALAAGALLRAYRFTRYRTTEKDEAKPTLRQLTIASPDTADAERAFERRRAVAEGVAFARDLVTEPPNVLYPESFAERLTSLSELGVEVEVLDVAAMTQLGMGSILSVGQGSVREPRIVVMRWQGAGADAAPVAFIGKGVTFDTGGISIKPGAGMEDMKFDMAGAAAVAGAIRALAARRARVNAVGVVGLAENMPSGNATRPSDVVTAMSGRTIEVINTDAEGRLVLADAIWYTKDRFKPRILVDLATLTGAILVALGTEYAGLFSNDEELARGLTEAGQAVGEKVWRMPLGEVYDKEIDSEIADVKNVAGSRNAGSVIGAQFIQRFVDGVPWAHLDIAGMAWSKKDTAIAPKGATGYGVRLLDRLVADRFETSDEG